MTSFQRLFHFMAEDQDPSCTAGVAANDRDIFYTKEKVMANVVVRDALERFYRLGDRVCVLDTDTAHSIGTLSSIVRDPECLVVPNPDGTIFEDMLPGMRDKCTCRVMTAGDYMRTAFAWPGPHHHWWLDYCCTLPTAEPDIRFLLDKLNGCPPQRPVLLALTFSIRGVTGGPEATADALNGIAKDYPALQVSGEPYTYRSMVFILATVMAALPTATIASPVYIGDLRGRQRESQPDSSAQEYGRVRHRRRRRPGAAGPKKRASVYLSLHMPDGAGVLTARFMDEHEAVLPAYAHLVEDGVCYVPRSPGRLSKFLGISRSVLGVLAYQIDLDCGMACGVPKAEMQPNKIVWV